MKKIFNSVLLIAIMLCFVQCETNKIGQNGTHKGHEYVDLGLSVKWATCNVGARKPKAYGDYFAWGEVEPKETYDFSTYKYCDGTLNTFTKYCSKSSYGKDGFTDNKTVLDPEDDAAAVNWGGRWRMPTMTEWEELIIECTWTKLNGVKGYKVTGRNGNSIFLPAAGCMVDSSFRLNAGWYGEYWSSSLDSSDPDYAGCIGFNKGGVSLLGIIRCNGKSVRPVCP